MGDILNCGHAFHDPCLKGLVDSNPNAVCPLCRGGSGTNHGNSRSVSEENGIDYLQLPIRRTGWALYWIHP
jgi:hypothetical protein